MNCDWCGRLYKAENGDLTCPYCGAENDKREQNKKTQSAVNKANERSERKLAEKIENACGKLSSLLASNPEFERKFIRFLIISAVTIGIALSIFIIYSWYWVYLALS